MGQSYTKLNEETKIKSTENINFDLRVEQINACIDNQLTEIDEKSKSVLKYKTPYFRADATVRFPPLASGEVWKLGWIQACTEMKFYNTYGRFGYWELPDLMNKSKPMISDSDGKNFPWYGNKTEVCLIKGPTKTSSSYSVHMNDNFCPHITWDIPVSMSRIKKPKLTNVKRDQSFITWLAAMDVNNGNFLVLKTIKWRMWLEIQVDPNKELGKRARLVSDPVPVQPEILKHNLSIPECALYPPNANSSQYLVWRPSERKSFVIIDPKCFQHENPYKANSLRNRLI